MTEVALSELSLEQPAIDQSFATGLVADLVAEDLPFCYMQTSNGELMDLTRLCGNGIRRQQTASTPVDPSAIAPAPAIVVPTSPVPKGAGCFLFDEQGRPCAASR
ncbi:MAG: hypothetical protein HC827_17845 [Cyanobacteria bacterium RM1_2_2]|nr:hypothetical protein [Cyanobacteria bacterium RM1_2_2]